MEKGGAFTVAEGNYLYRKYRSLPPHKGML